MHRTVSPLTNHFLSVTGMKTLGFGLGFGRRRYGRLFLAIAGLFVYKHVAASLFSCRHKIILQAYINAVLRRLTLHTGWAKNVSCCTLSISSLNIDQCSQIFLPMDSVKIFLFTGMQGKGTDRLNVSFLQLHGDADV